MVLSEIRGLFRKHACSAKVGGPGHPDCILEACGVQLKRGDDRQHVPDAIARRLWERQQKPIVWDDVPIRARRRLRDKVKRQLIHDAAARMTPQLLRESDPHGEIRGWLTTIAELLGPSVVCLTTGP